MTEKNNMTVYELRGKVSTAGPGVEGYDAEAKVDIGNHETMYAHVTYSDGEKFYGVIKESFYDYVAGHGEGPKEGFVEEYESLEEAKESEYYEAFIVLDSMVRLMADGIHS